MANSDIWNSETSTQSFFQEVENKFGIQTKHMMKNILNNNKKLASLHTRNMFLKRCRRHDILPKSLNINLKAFNHCINKGVLSRLAKSFSQSIRNEVIKQLYRNTVAIKTKLTKDEDCLKNIIPNELFDNFIIKVKTTHDKLINSLSDKQQKKFEKLIEPEIKNVQKMTNQNNWIKNLTGRTIPQEHLNILSLGDKFNLPIKNHHTPNAEIIAHLEPTIQKLENTLDRTELRNKLCNILTNHRKMRGKKTTFDTILHMQIEKTKQYLKENPDILVLNADKGNVTVLMNKNDYIHKMETLLNDNGTYQILKEDPTNKIEAKCNRLITQWKNQEFITIHTAKRLRRYNSLIAKMYGQIKIHKEGNPPRPVVASIQSPTYNLSKWYAEILKNVTGKTRRSIKNSTQFKEKMDNVRLPDGYVLVSLDVISLFTKIPKELVYLALDKNWFKIKKHTTLPKNEFIRGIKMIMENCTFSFNGTIYEQIFGSPMGSPVSPVLADLVMEMLEDEVLKKLNFRLPFYSRYVDDSSTACPLNKTDELRRIFNSYNENLQFTIEVEKDDKIPFLDCMLHRQKNGLIKTNWFHKNTWSGRYLNFHSHLPFNYKRNTIMILTDKVLKLADRTFHDENFKLIVETLKKNGYPEKLITSTMEKTIQQNAKPSNKTKNSKEKFVSVPYIKGVFEKIKPLFEKENIKVVGKGSNNLKKNMFSQIKDKIPINKQSHVIYSVKCSCDSVYVGQTMRHLEKRIADHQYHTRTKNSTHSALCEHLIDTKHTVNWDHIKILHKEHKQNVRDVMEMIYIKKTDKTINKQNECKFLSNTYNNILNINS